MALTTYRNRRAASIENEQVRVTVLEEGGHIAEIFDRDTGVNPLWTPPWPSIEPSTWTRERNPEYGDDAESKLLAGIMGHNLCLDLFGSPSIEEAAAGMTVHGEASVARYEIRVAGESLSEKCELKEAGLEFERRIELRGRVLVIDERVTNARALDRPIAWTEHVTLGPPFVERGATELRAPATRSHSLDTGEDFSWPMAPLAAGGRKDLRTYVSEPATGGFTTHLMDPRRERAYFLAYSPALKMLFGYVWKRSDFPWLGIWEENHSRKQPPWNGETLTWGLEFGASPLPESRRRMIDRRGLFGEQGYRWAAAKATLDVRYYAFIARAEAIPESLEELRVELPAD